MNRWKWLIPPSLLKKKGKDPAKSKWFTPENRSSLWPNWLILRTHSYDMCNHSNLGTRLFDDNLPMLLLMVCLAKSLSTTLHSAAFPKWLNSMSYFWQRFNSFFLMLYSYQPSMQLQREHISDFSNILFEYSLALFKLGLPLVGLINHIIYKYTC
jgi:hypothetical protein